MTDAQWPATADANTARALADIGRIADAPLIDVPADFEFPPLVLPAPITDPALVGTDSDPRRRRSSPADGGAARHRPPAG